MFIENQGQNQVEKAAQLKNISNVSIEIYIKTLNVHDNTLGKQTVSHHSSCYYCCKLIKHGFIAFPVM